MAIRFPKHVLAMSGLRDVVEMEVTREHITLRAATDPRAGWEEHIARTAATCAATQPDPELAVWEDTALDGFEHEAH